MAVRDEVAHFHKYHALGNDYIVLDPRSATFALTPGAIRLICDRHRGIGADGILFGPQIEDGRISVRIFNPDGGEAEKSGNGIRIFSRYLIEAGYVSGESYTLYTLGGSVRVEFLAADASQMRVDMGRISFWSPDIPAGGAAREVVDEPLQLGDRQVQISALSIGNPHCVVVVEDVSPELARQHGPRIERHPLFPQRTNVQFMQVLDRGSVQIEIWERGAGYTQASGSSSCAAAAVAHRLGLVDNPVQVHMPGGMLVVDLRPDGQILLTGPVSAVYHGEFAPELWVQLQS